VAQFHGNYHHAAPARNINFYWLIVLKIEGAALLEKGHGIESDEYLDG
jgi:hypothetical protein